MLKITMNFALISTLCSPAISAEPAGKALAQLGLAVAVYAPAVPVSAPAPAEARELPAQSWADAAKAAYDKAQDEGGLTAFADLKELPPGARRRLEQELQSLPQGPGNTSEAFKMMVGGRTAFVIQSYINSDSLRVYIFNAAGVYVACGAGSVDTQFAWLPLPASARSADASSRMAITPIQAEVTQNPSTREASADDWSSRIRVKVRETAQNAYSVELRAGYEAGWPEVTRTADGKLVINDWNMNLSMAPAKDGYLISGFVTDEDGRKSMVAMTMRTGADAFTGTVTGFGTNLRVAKDSIGGYYDFGQYSPKAIAGVLSLIICHRISQL